MSYLGIDEAAKEIMENINDYMGQIFKRICARYIERLAISKNYLYTGSNWILVGK